MDIKETNMEIKKHQDYIYLKENYFRKPKKHFIDKEKIIKKNFNKKKITLLDLGCAKGELIFYLDKKKLIKNAYGIDYSPSLIKQAKKNSKNNIIFKKNSAENLKLKSKFDVIILSGLISYFDNLKKIFQVLKKHLNTKGIILIFDKFNDHNVDIIVKYKNNKFSKKFEKGWNFHSIDTIKKIAKENGLNSFKKIKFKINFKLKKTNDPARSWITKLNGKKKLINGLNQYYDLHFLILKKAK